MPDPTRLLEMFETMAEIEASCGRLAARRLTPEHQAALAAALEACRAAAEAGDLAEYYAENTVFHAVIYRASRNGFLCEQALALSRRLAPFRRVQLRARNGSGSPSPSMPASSRRSSPATRPGPPRGRAPTSSSRATASPT